MPELDIGGGIKATYTKDYSFVGNQNFVYTTSEGKVYSIDKTTGQPTQMTNGRVMKITKQLFIFGFSPQKLTNPVQLLQ